MIFVTCMYIFVTIMSTVKLIRTTQTVSLQRNNYDIEIYLNYSVISIIFSSANTVTAINLI